MEGAPASHLVPVVYLKSWRDRTAGQPPQVWLADKNTLAAELRPCDSVLVERRFYAAVDGKGSLSDKTEETLSSIESRFGFIRKQLALQRELSRDDHRAYGSS